MPRGERVLPGRLGKACACPPGSLACEVTKPPPPSKSRRLAAGKSNAQARAPPHQLDSHCSQGVSGTPEGSASTAVICPRRFVYRARLTRPGCLHGIAGEAFAATPVQGVILLSLACAATGIRCPFLHGPSVGLAYVEQRGSSSAASSSRDALLGCPIWTTVSFRDVSGALEIDNTLRIRRCTLLRHLELNPNVWMATEGEEAGLQKPVTRAGIWLSNGAVCTRTTAVRDLAAAASSPTLDCGDASGILQPRDRGSSWRQQPNERPPAP